MQTSRARLSLPAEPSFFPGQLTVSYQWYVRITVPFTFKTVNTTDHTEVHPYRVPPLPPCRPSQPLLSPPPPSSNVSRRFLGQRTRRERERALRSHHLQQADLPSPRSPSRTVLTEHRHRQSEHAAHLPPLPRGPTPHGNHSCVTPFPRRSSFSTCLGDEDCTGTGWWN
jgi:hypothetical protein